MFVYNINKRSLPCLILLLLFNSLWMKFKLLTKALWDLVPASVKPPLSICSHCCLNHISPQCRELWGIAHRSWLRTFECARRLCFVTVPTLRHILALFSACSDPFHLPGFPQCSHPTSSYFPVRAPFVSTRGCITHCNYMLFASLQAFSLHQTNAPWEKRLYCVLPGQHEQSLD